VSDSLAQVREEIAVANRILSNEGVVDAFGHASVRHPTDPNRFFISRHRAPQLVLADDLIEFTLDYKPVKPTTLRMYSEGIIHGAIYQARPEVMSVCHHHSPAVLPFCISGAELVPVFHLGASMGAKVPFWDQQDEFGDTDLLVKTAEEGASLARALGDNWTVLLRRHGATVAGTSIREMVFRTIYGCVNAELQWKAQQQGHVQRLTPGEAARGGGHNIKAGPLERAWDFWEHRLRVAGGHPAGAASAKPAAAKAAKPAAAKTSAAKPKQAKKAKAKTKR
jgi:ribulose-5-phosphate 4-epimerase/fuculose-1-phosphate aldolase